MFCEILDRLLQIMKIKTLIDSKKKTNIDFQTKKEYGFKSERLKRVVIKGVHKLLGTL